MVVIVPLFPLKLVAFPGEKINLHIFEPRYKDLVNDVMSNDKKFGIPAYLKNKIDYGTLMEITEISRTYEDGRMDIKTVGLSIFRVIDYLNPAGGKKYAEGTVEFIKNHPEQDPYLKSYMIEKLEEFFRLVSQNDTESLTQDIISFDIVHKLGLNQDEEYHILTMDHEIQRQQYIVDYLDKALPVIKRVEKAKEIIKMNGYFKYLDPIKF